MQVDKFKNIFDGGTRPNRFRVSGKIGNVGELGLDREGLLVRATSFPNSTIGVIPIPYRGRTIKYPGDRQYPEWAIQLYDDRTVGFRDKFVQWQEQFNEHVSNVPADSNSLDLRSGRHIHFVDWNVDMMDVEGNVIRSCRLVNCWPMDISPYDLSYDVSDRFNEYSVTLAFDYIDFGNRGSVNTGFYGYRNERGTNASEATP